MRLPTPEELAALAMHARKETPTEAVTHALAVWREAHAQLHETAARLRAEAEAEAAKGVRWPERFPASFNDVLRQIVHAKSDAQGERRLLDFLRYREHRMFEMRKPERTTQTDAEFAEDLARHKADLAKREADLKRKPKGWLESEIKRLATRELTRLKADGIKLDVSWRSFAEDFNRWWRCEVSAKRRDAGRRAG